MQQKSVRYNHNLLRIEQIHNTRMANEADGYLRTPQQILSSSHPNVTMHRESATSALPRYGHPGAGRRVVCRSTGMLRREEGKGNEDVIG